MRPIAKINTDQEGTTPSPRGIFTLYKKVKGSRKPHELKLTAHST